MEAKELRIGNWIQYPQTADIARAGYYFGQVSEISEKHNTINIKNYILATDFKLSECKPILLNEEWLLKLGLEKDEENYYGEADISYHIYADVFNRINFKNGKWELVSTELDSNDRIQYVHQLQNLYFALTGQELTLTPAKEMK